MKFAYRLRSAHKGSGAFVLAALLLSACATQVPQPHTDALLPEAWQGDSGHAGSETIARSDHWWEEFNNTELNQLMDQAMQSNFGLLASYQRIEQARARLTASRSTLFPQLDATYSANANHTRFDEQSVSTESDRANLSASYEVDLWGRLRAATDASEAALAGSRYNHQTIALSLQAQVASSYFQYLAAKDRLRFAEESLQNSEQLLRLVELQFNEGAASRLELVQQQSSVVSQQAQINSLRNSLDQVSFAIDILLGQRPGTFQLSGQSLNEIALPTIAAGQPADLLQRRPDVLQSETALAAAHANVAIARAAFFPSLRITGGTSVNEVLLGDPVSQISSLAASLTAPLFDAGRNRSEYNRTLAAQEEALLNYYQTLLTAVGEVQSSLLNVDQQTENVSLQAKRLNLSQESHDLAELRYREGSADFITLLDAERNLINAQDVYVQAQLERHLEAVALYRALGGSWFSER